LIFIEKSLTHIRINCYEKPLEIRTNKKYNVSLREITLLKAVINIFVRFLGINPARRNYVST